MRGDKNHLFLLAINRGIQWRIQKRKSLYHYIFRTIIKYWYAMICM